MHKVSTRAAAYQLRSESFSMSSSGRTSSGVTAVGENGHAVESENEGELRDAVKSSNLQHDAETPKKKRRCGEPVMAVVLGETHRP